MLVRFGFNNKGFSLLEVILVMVLTGICSVAAVAFVGGSDEARLEGVAKKIVADLSYVRRLSVNNNRTYQVSFLHREGISNYSASHPSMIYPVVDPMNPTTCNRGVCSPNNLTVDLKQLPL